MESFSELLQQGSANLWLFIPTALLLGALHGLEPGHSKTMMAAFIIAVRGTVSQAVLLGLAAALSHTAIVWAIALGGQYLGRGYNTEMTEPYILLASAVIVLGIGVWMIWRTRADQQAESAHHHHDDRRRIDTGHGVMTLEIFEGGAPPRWRIHFENGHGWKADEVVLVTDRGGGDRQSFAFADRGDHLESIDEVPEPHEFSARVSLGHSGHSHDYDVRFTEHDHGHDGDAQTDTLREELKATGDDAYMDAHERAHAADISRRFASRNVTTGQIVVFGLTGGLVPCPAAVTVLLLCLQLKKLVLGVVLVSCFSIGLAVTMVTVGVVASLSVKHIQKRWSGFGAFARRAPYASATLMLIIAGYMAFSGWTGLAHAAAR